MNPPNNCQNSVPSNFFRVISMRRAWTSFRRFRRLARPSVPSIRKRWRKRRTCLAAVAHGIRCATRGVCRIARPTICRMTMCRIFSGTQLIACAAPRERAVRPCVAGRCRRTKCAAPVCAALGRYLSRACLACHLKSSRVHIPHPSTGRWSLELCAAKLG